MFNVISITESYQTKRINKDVVEMTFYYYLGKNGSSLKWISTASRQIQLFRV